jgi:hypothetical protein
LRSKQAIPAGNRRGQEARPSRQEIAVSTRHRISAFAICAAVAVVGLTDASARGFGDAHRGGSVARVGQTFHPALRQTAPVLRSTSSAPVRLAKICEDNPRLCPGGAKPRRVPPHYPPGNIGNIGLGSFGQGVSSNQPGQGANQGSASTPVYTLPPAILKEDALIAQYRENVQLNNELTNAMTYFESALGCYAEETQLLQNKIQQLQQQIASPNCDTTCIEQAGLQIQNLQALLQSLSTAVAQWEWIFITITGAGSNAGLSTIPQVLAWIAAVPGYGAAIGPAGVQSIVNQLTTAETVMYAGEGSNVPSVSYNAPPSCNAWEWYF